MKQYYQDKIVVLEEQISLAKKGFITKMKDTGIGMTNTNTYEEMSARVEEAAKSVCAIKELEEDLENAKKRLAEEEAKESKKNENN